MIRFGVGRLASEFRHGGRTSLESWNRRLKIENEPTSQGSIRTVQASILVCRARDGSRIGVKVSRKEESALRCLTSKAIGPDLCLYSIAPGLLCQSTILGCLYSKI